MSILIVMGLEDVMRFVGRGLPRGFRLLVSDAGQAPLYDLTIAVPSPCFALTLPSPIGYNGRGC